MNTSKIDTAALTAAVAANDEAAVVRILRAAGLTLWGVVHGHDSAGRYTTLDVGLYADPITVRA